MIRKAVVLGRSALVLTKRRAFDPWRPDEALRAVLAVRAYGPFAGVVALGSRRAGQSTAVIDEDGSVTFEDLEAQSNALARGLASLGVQAGSVVAILCRDHRYLIITMVAANKLGARLVLMNTGFAAPQLASVAERENVSAMVFDAKFQSRLGHLDDKVARVQAWGGQVGANLECPTVAGLIAAHPTSRLRRPAKPGGMVLLTSGTTGTPKGAPRDRIDPMQTAQLLDRIPLPRRSAYLLAAPLFHGTGLSIASLGLALGNAVVTQRTFDPERTLQSIERHRATTLVVVPTMLQRIVDLGPTVLRKYDMSSLKVVFAAGSSLSPDLCARTRAAFGDVLYNLYGSTEVAVATVATPDDLRRAPGTVGRPPVGCTVALYDDNDQRITAPGVTGRIFVSSGLSFAGYTDGGSKPSIDGLLSSGDLGYFDRTGLWFVVGRDDDMIVSGGENVFPLEIENLLLTRPDIHDAAVIGVDDRDFGKRLRAFIVAPGSPPTAEEIKSFVKDNLARHKVPRDVVIVDHLPRNATGKLLRRELADVAVPDVSAAAPSRRKQAPSSRS